MNNESNTITPPQGFLASGLHCGIKPDKKDLALFYSEYPATVAGTFTINRVQAAPVKLCRQRISSGMTKAVVVNSGNANACTGEQGLRDAHRMTQLVGTSLGIPEEQVLVCSTGHIGHPLPMDHLESGIRKATTSLSIDGFSDAAEAILTTDTHTKTGSTRVEIDGKTVTLTAIAKGSGMIEPTMATMLAFGFTDAAIERDALNDLCSTAVEQSFNRITVDGDQSTNDTVLLLANGHAGNEPLHPDHPDWPTFKDALFNLTRTLALSIVRDGEGATKVATVHVTGAQSNQDAEKVARAVANSSLIKTSWAGGQANWGRVMDAVGYSRAYLVEEKVDIDYDHIRAVEGGQFSGGQQEQLDQIVQQEAFTLHIHLNQGKGKATVYSCDTTEEYVRINVEE